MQYAYDHFDRQLLMDDMRFATGPKPGDRVPDQPVRNLDGEPIQLGELHPGKPLLLTFGSITCPMTMDAMPILKRLHHEFGDDVVFATLYVREAHPGDRYPQPHTFEQKRSHARTLRDRDDIPWQILVDDVDGNLHRALDPKPTAAYLLGPDGTVLSRMLWANYERPLRQALRKVVRSGPHPMRQHQDRMIPMMRGVANMRRVLDAAGPTARRDVLRQAPPVYAMATLMDTARRRPVATAVAGLAVLGLGAWWLSRRD